MQPGGMNQHSAWLFRAKPCDVDAERFSIRRAGRDVEAEHPGARGVRLFMKAPGGRGIVRGKELFSARHKCRSYSSGAKSRYANADQFSVGRSTWSITRTSTSSRDAS